MMVRYRLITVGEGSICAYDITKIFGMEILLLTAGGLLMMTLTLRYIIIHLVAHRYRGT